MSTRGARKVGWRAAARRGVHEGGYDPLRNFDETTAGIREGEGRGNRIPCLEGAGARREVRGGLGEEGKKLERIDSLEVWEQGAFLVVVLLVLDIGGNTGDVPAAHRERAVSFLPAKEAF